MCIYIYICKYIIIYIYINKIISMGRWGWVVLLKFNYRENPIKFFMALDKCFSSSTRWTFPPLAFFFTQTAFNVNTLFSLFPKNLPPSSTTPPVLPPQFRVRGETICPFLHSPLGQPLVPTCFQSLGTVNCTRTSTTSPLSRKRRMFAPLGNSSFTQLDWSLKDNQGIINIQTSFYLIRCHQDFYDT